MSMSSLLTLSNLGKICGSSHSNEMVVLDRVKRKNSVRRMSIIEDGEIAEVLYLIPKQSMMEQLPFINPNDYLLCEKLDGIPAKMSVCGCDLAHSGFFMKNSDYLCPLDFQRLHGTLCNNCGEFVEGQVVTVLGKTYHPACFVCTVCKQPFPAGDCVTFSGKDCLCQRCIQPASPTNGISSSSNCSGCGRDIKNGQALLALDSKWHLGCFKCKTCRRVLSGEYISKDGVPYCERDYQIQFGVQCEECQKFITGKVLEAGEKHYHPSCARCSRCNKMFTEGEEMYLQGSTVWHPDCRDSNRTEDSYMVRPPGCDMQAKLDNEIIDYRHLAAIPRVKAIYDIEHPEMISYKSVNNSSTLDNKDNRQEKQSPSEVTPFNAPSSVRSKFLDIPHVLSAWIWSQWPQSASRSTRMNCLQLVVEGE
ncbi:hypothetical protein FQN60_003255 [Etheostoma spectabile]|uniref:LIM zinc-binding domain-containing protein n=1 Tax=Etheostoma spectabile TaxID=54343 RepID=A0A5J5CIP5_9PERO|nr:hypothetical protein FQN60_003255 [Etheostoma spectabile]